MQKYWWIYSFIFLAFLACSKPKQSELKIFKYNQASGITSLDPAFAKNQANIWAVSQLFNGLVQLDSNMNIVPCIAKKWNFSEDALTITFILRDDVYFHENELFENKKRVVNAQDFVYSFNRIIDKQTASPGAWIFNGKVAGNEPFKALNDTVFQLNLKEPFAPILGILTMPYCFVVPKEIIDFYGRDFRAHPVGTGAFKFKIWEEGIALVALKNNNYFEQDSKGVLLPYLDGFKVTFNESKKMEYLNFMKGNLDMLSGVDKSFVKEIFTEEATLQKKWQNNIKLYKAPFLNTEYLGINLETNNKWLNQKKFRQALNYCFSKEEMIQYFRNGIGFPAVNGFIPKNLPPNTGNYLNGYNYDIEKAKQLLKEIDYNGDEIVLNTNETYKDIGLYIANQAEKAGVKIKIEVVQPSLLREWMVSGEVDFFRGSWIADYPDAENYLSLFYSKNGAPPNYTRFKNDTFDLYYEQAKKSFDVQEQMNLYTKMDSIIIEEAPVVFLYYDELIRLTHENIFGAKPNAFNNLDLKIVKKK
ncbi:MAG: ABC transporter substrate-binding protein [Chitinophagales bacterium]|nr:ABC transporter substrate-binding protein [Chitinophagales bacterium]